MDRSAAYAARYVAKNIVAAGLAEKCEIQLSYAIGVAHPTSIMVDTFGTGKLHDDKLVEIIRENFDLRPAGIIKMLDRADLSTSRPLPMATLDVPMWIALGEAGQGGFIEEIPGIVTSHAKMKQELFPGVYSQGTVPVLILCGTCMNEAWRFIWFPLSPRSRPSLPVHTLRYGTAAVLRR